MYVRILEGSEGREPGSMREGGCNVFLEGGVCHAVNNNSN